MSEPIWSAEALTSQRSSGYKDTASAISELIDNAFDANAQNIKIIFIEEYVHRIRNGNKQRHKEIKEILICDDGDGMDENILRSALRFGKGLSKTLDESDAIRARRKGKFGYGLPNASISQCEIVTVYSWQQQDKILTTKLDLPLCIKTDNVFLPEPKQTTLSDDYEKFGAVIDKKHGTIVSWTNIDRISNATTNANIRHLKKRLGRLFRHLIENDKASITFHHFFRESDDHIETLTTDDNHVRPLDPLFLMSNTGISEDIWNTSQATTPQGKKYKKFAISKSKHKPTSHRYEDGCFTYEFIWGDKSYKFEITTTHADIDIQKPGVRNGGDVGIGKTYYGDFYNKAGNISFVRADREIESGTFDIYTKGAPEHRFWAIEIKFDQDADDLMGVENNKQGTRFTKYHEDPEQRSFDMTDGNLVQGREKLRRELSHHLTQISQKVFKAVKAQGREWDSIHVPKPTPSPIPTDDPTTEKVTTIVDQIASIQINEEELRSLRANLATRFPNVSEEDINVVTASWQQKGRRAVIIYAPFNTESLWSSESYKGLLLITFNTSHPFYEHLIRPLREQKDARRQLASFELFIHSFAAVEQDLAQSDEGRNSRMLNRFRENVGQRVTDYLSALEDTIADESDENDLEENAS